MHCFVWNVRTLGCCWTKAGGWHLCWGGHRALSPSSWSKWNAALIAVFAHIIAKFSLWEPAFKQPQAKGILLLAEALRSPLYPSNPYQERKTQKGQSLTVLKSIFSATNAQKCPNFKLIYYCFWAGSTKHVWLCSLHPLCCLFHCSVWAAHTGTVQAVAQHKLGHHLV